MAEESNKLGWSFKGDPELAQQLRAIKSGRGLPIAMIVGGLVCAVTAVLVVV